MYSNSDDFAQVEAGEVGRGTSLQADGADGHALLAGVYGEFAQGLRVGTVDEEGVVEVEGQGSSVRPMR